MCVHSLHTVHVYEGHICESTGTLICVLCVHKILVLYVYICVC